jgi:hypothetical protein
MYTICSSWQDVLFLYPAHISPLNMYTLLWYSLASYQWRRNSARALIARGNRRSDVLACRRRQSFCRDTGRLRTKTYLSRAIHRASVKSTRNCRTELGRRSGPNSIAPILCASDLSTVWTRYRNSATDKSRCLTRLALAGHLALLALPARERRRCLYNRRSGAASQRGSAVQRRVGPVEPQEAVTR